METALNNRRGPRYMNLLTDFGFKYVFGSEHNKSTLIKLLNTLLKGKEVIVDVAFRDKEALPFKEDEKRMVFDIYCTTQNGSHIIVEMQRTIQPTFANRALAYCCHCLLKQIKIGGRYTFDKVYGIFIMDFHLIDLPKRLYRNVSLMEEDSKESFTDKLNMCFLDLSLMNKNNLDECENEIERWSYLIKNMENMKEKNMRYPEYDDLFDAAETDKLASDAYVTYSNSRMKLEDDRAGLEYYGEQQRKLGREEGREKGREEGFLQGIKLAVEAMKRSGMSLQNAIDSLNRPAGEIEALWNA